MSTFRKQKRDAGVVADARSPQRNYESDDQKPTGGLGEHATDQGTVAPCVLPVEGFDRRLGNVCQRQNPFGRTNTCRRQ